jgi:hypothetical protein
MQDTKRGALEGAKEGKGGEGKVEREGMELKEGNVCKTELMSLQ